MSLAFSPDGKRLASGGDRVLRMWDVATTKQLHVFGSGSQMRSLVFSPDGKTLAVGRHDKVVRLYDADTAKEIRALNHTGLIGRNLPGDVVS